MDIFEAVGAPEGVGTLVTIEVGVEVIAGRPEEDDWVVLVDEVSAELVDEVLTVLVDKVSVVLGAAMG